MKKATLLALVFLAASGLIAVAHAETMTKVDDGAMAAGGGSSLTRIEDSYKVNDSYKIKDSFRVTDSMNRDSSVKVSDVHVSLAASELAGTVSGNTTGAGPHATLVTGGNEVGGSVMRDANGIGVFSQNTGTNSLVQQSVNVQVNMAH